MSAPTCGAVKYDGPPPATAAPGDLVEETRRGEPGRFERTERVVVRCGQPLPCKAHPIADEHHEHLPDGWVGTVTVDRYNGKPPLWMVRALIAQGCRCFERNPGPCPIHPAEGATGRR